MQSFDVHELDWSEPRQIEFSVPIGKIICLTHPIFAPAIFIGDLANTIQPYEGDKKK